MNSLRFCRQLLLLITLPLILSAPFIFSASFETSDDFHFHVVWHSLFKSQLLMGDLYPRWLIEQNNGFGAPTFRYYGPAAFYLSSIISLLIPTATAGYQIAFVAVAFVLLSALSCFFWLRRTFPERESLISALIYSIAPYHLAIDLYKRLAFAELLTFVWMPLILLAVESLISKRGDRFKFKGIAALAFCYAGLILTHPPTTLIFSGLPILYVMLVASHDRKLQTIKVVIGMLAGSALSAVYLFPALFDQNLVRIDLHQSEYFDFHNWFLFPTVVPTKYNRTLAVLTGLQLALVVGAFAICYKVKNQNISKRWFWLIIASGACFMMSTPSTFLYELVTPLQQIQFSSRFNVLLLLSTSFAFAELLSVSNNFSSWKKYIGPAVLLGFSCLTVAVTYKTWLYMLDVSQSYSADQQQIRVGIGKKVIAGDFLPLGTPFLNRDNLSSLEALFKNSRDKRVAFLKGSATAEVKQWGPEEILIRVDAKEISTLAVRQIYSRTHKAEIIDSNRSLAITPIPDLNIITVDIPAGISTVSLRHSATRAESIGLICSFSTVILLIVFGARGVFSRND